MGGGEPGLGKGWACCNISAACTAATPCLLYAAPCLPHLCQRFISCRLQTLLCAVLPLLRGVRGRAGRRAGGRGSRALVEQALRPALLTVVGLQWGCHSLVGLPKATSTGPLSSAVRLLTLDARAPSSRAASGRFGMLLARRLTDGAGLCPWVVGAGGRAAGGRRVCSAGRCSRILAALAGLNRQERLARDGWEEELTLAAPGRGQKRKAVTTHDSSSYAVCPSRVTSTAQSGSAAINLACQVLHAAASPTRAILAAPKQGQRRSAQLSWVSSPASVAA